jgi:HSP20 family protein
MEVRLLNNEYMPDGWLAKQLASFWNDFNRDLESNDGRIAPAADVVEDAEGYHFWFEMPGLKTGSLDVRVEEGRLIVEGERVRAEWPKDAHLHLAERTYGKLRRTFRVPEDASHDGISASYRDGILAVNVPKKPEGKPMRIKVNSN